MKLSRSSAISSVLVAVLLTPFDTSHVQADIGRQRTKSGNRTEPTASDDDDLAPSCTCVASKVVYPSIDQSEGKPGNHNLDVVCTGNGTAIKDLPFGPAPCGPGPGPASIVNLTLVNYRLHRINGSFFGGVKQRLRELHLIGNHITDLDSTTFQEFKHLTVLSLKNSSLSSLPLSPFSGTKTLKILDLSYNQFHDSQFVSSRLCVRGIQFPTLETLILQGCGLRRLAPDGFAQCNLRVLDLSNNKLLRVGRDELTFHYKTQFISEIKINLENNRIHTISVDSGVADVLEVCQQASKQTTLLLSGNQFCCNDEMLWIRNFTACIDGDQPCYPSNQIKARDSLFTFTAQQSETCEQEPHNESELKWPLYLISLGAIIPLLLVVVVTTRCVRYRRHHSRMYETDIVDDISDSMSSYGSTEILSELRSFLVPYTSLHLRERIGTGGFGTVYRGKLHGCTVAIKMLNLGSCASASSIDDFLQEAEVLSKLHHQNIVRLLGLCTATGHACIVMEYVRRGSVKNMLRVQNTAIGWLPKLLMLVGAANGMVYLHSRQPPVVHRDLKSSNLLVDRQWRVKVCDFGVSKHLKHVVYDSSDSSSSGSRNTRAPGTLRFTAPEMMSDQPKLTPKADIYSFGIVMWEFAAASVAPPHDYKISNEASAYLCPFADLAWSHQIVEAVCQGRRPCVPASCPAPVQTLMKHCWHGRARNRPTFPEVLETLQHVANEMGLTLSSENSENEP